MLVKVTEGLKSPIQEGILYALLKKIHVLWNWLSSRQLLQSRKSSQGGVNRKKKYWEKIKTTKQKSFKRVETARLCVCVPKRFWSYSVCYPRKVLLKKGLSVSSAWKKPTPWKWGQLSHLLMSNMQPAWISQLVFWKPYRKVLLHLLSEFPDTSGLNNSSNCHQKV